MPTDTSLDFKTPDLKLMADVQTLIYNHIKSLQLDFLPVMKEKLPYVQAALSQANHTFRKELTHVLTTARHTDLNHIDRTRSQIEADTELSVAQRADALEQVNAQRIHVLLKLVNALRQAQRAMLLSIDDLLQIGLKPANDRLEKTLQERLEAHQQGMAERARKIAELKADKKILDDAIAAYEKSNLVEIFKNALPTPEELSALTSVPVSEIALIKAGIERLQKLLGEVGKGLTYLDMTAERDRLRERYNQLIEESRQLDEKIRELSHDLQQLLGLAELDQVKTTWATEARVAADALRMFSDAYLTDTRVSNLTQQRLQELVVYLSSFVTTEREL